MTGRQEVLIDLGTAPDTHDAVVFPDQTVSRCGLAGRADALAGRLGGAKAMAVCATASLETVVAVLAGLMARVPVVPISPDSGIAERGHILRDSGAEMFAGSVPWADSELPVIPIPSGDRPGDGPSTVAAGESALILYTSGTTGLPKGVPISGPAMAADLDALAGAWDWTAEDTLVHGLPLFHVHGLILGVLGAFRTGSRLIHTGRPRPDRYAAAPGSLYFGVPTVWSRVCEDAASAAALRAARLLVSGSAPLPVPVFNRLAELTGHRPVERYGMTETLITISSRAHGERRRAGWVGRPLEGVETRIVDDDGTMLPEDGDAVGDLEVRAPTVTAGYLAVDGRLSRPRADFRAGGWFHTGDVATIGYDGFHRIVGRRSTDLIKSGGYRIGAGEVEAALLSHPGVKDAAVIGVPDDDLGEAVAAYVVADDVNPSDLETFVADQLSVHKRPRRVVFLAELPMNAMGKVQKSKLPI